MPSIARVSIHSKVRIATKELSKTHRSICYAREHAYIKWTLGIVVYLENDNKKITDVTVNTLITLSIQVWNQILNFFFDKKKKRKQQNNVRIMTCLIRPPQPQLIYIRVNRDSKSFSGSYSFLIQTAPIRRIPDFFLRNIIICFYLNCRLDIFSCTHFFVALMKIVNWSRCIYFAYCLTSFYSTQIIHAS